MKILVLGGMHGNEPLGLAVVKMFQKWPVKDVDAEYANERAIKAGVRFTSADLNRSFPGNVTSDEYEVRRAAELVQIASGYDVVLDFHNTHCPDNDCGFVGDIAQQPLYDAAWVLGIDKVIVADYDCINKYASNCLSVEISISSPQNDVKLWYERITMLSRINKVMSSPVIAKYRFVYRISLEDKARLDLPSKKLRAFQPLTKELAASLGVKWPAYPIFIGDGYTPYNYGGLLNKLN